MMYKRRYTLFITAFIFILAGNTACSQVHHKQLIQFSGVVVNKSTLKPIPYAALMIKTSDRGTICDNNGYFSFVAQPTDTIEFAALGYKTNVYYIPDTLTDRYALIHLMDKDTTMLNAVTVYPWPSKEAFKRAFLSLKLPENDAQRARKNLILARAKAQMEGNPMDAQASFMNAMQEEYNKLYYAGQYPPNNLLNPLAWAQFIQAWKDGSLKIQ